MTLELWAFRAEVSTEGADLRGLAVQALDGGIGKVEEVVERESRTILLVDTGPWIFGKTVKLPAGLVAGVDAEQGIVLVDRPKDDIKKAPEPDGDGADDAAHEAALARHYGGGGDEEAPAAAPPAPLGQPAATAPGGSGTPAAGGPEIPAPAATAPGLADRDADRADDEAPAAPIGATSAPAPAERTADAGAGDGATGASARPPAVAAETPEPSTPEPSADDAAPAPLSALVTGTPPEAEERAPEPPRTPPVPAPERRSAPALERPRPASAPSRERAPERPAARKRAETPSPAKPARKRADAGSRATSAEAEKAPKTRARAESAPPPAKRRARSGASARNDQPIARYDALTAAEVVGRLRALTQSELAKVERYEKRGEERQTILKRVGSLREKEPWRGYDTATVKEVRERLARAKQDRVTAVRDYERRHRNRTGVMEAARRRLETM
jgi:hypothetical protein